MRHISAFLEINSTLAVSRVPGERLSTMGRPEPRSALLSAAISGLSSPFAPAANMSSALMKSRPHVAYSFASES